MSLLNTRIRTKRLLFLAFALAAVFATGDSPARADEASFWRNNAVVMKAEAARAREVAAGVASGLAHADRGNELVRDLAAQSESLLQRGEDFTAAADSSMEEEKYERAYRLYSTAKLYFTGSATAGLNAKSVLHSIEGPRNKPAGTENGKLYTTKEAVK
jgi:hypothetical protein